MKIWVHRHRGEIILGGSVLLVVAMFFIRFGGFASEVDWLGQHSVFPDYFRRLFYRTGELFPSFAANIGGGQNIYNFSYYGFLSPLILPSYLLPFLPMSYYLMGVSALCLLASVLLLYHWLVSRGMGQRLSCAMGLVWLFAAPIIYHSHTQWMFVNYMPFLILAFIGVDWYMEKGKTGLMTAAVFLMIMTSYYYSIAGILALGLYQLARCVRQMGRFRIAAFIKKEISFGCYILLSVAMSGILLVPTAYTLLGRSDSGKDTYTLAELLLPGVSWDSLTYSTYGIGLTTMLVTAVLSAVFCRKAWERVLGFSLWAVLFVPVFAWLLNGCLYIRGKSLIPFLPLLVYWMAHFLMKLKRKEISTVQGAACFGVTVLLVFAYGEWDGDNFGVLVTDAVVMLAVYAVYVFYSWYSRRKNQQFHGRFFLCAGEMLIIVPVILLLVGGFLYNFFMEDNSISEELFAYTEDAEPGRIMDGLLQGDTLGYRVEKRGNLQEDFADVNRIYTSNQRISTLYSSAYAAQYNDFREAFDLNKTHRNILIQGSSCNPLFLRLMGVKYLISNKELPFEEKAIDGGYHVYDCGLTAPLGYVTDRLVSEEEYDKLSFPYNQLVLTSYAVAGNDAGTQDYQTEKPVKTMQGTGQQGEEAEPTREADWQEELANAVREVDWQKDFFAENRDFATREEDGGYHINRKESIQLQVKFPENMDGDKLFFVSFHVANHHRGSDVSVEIGPEKNKLSAYYLYYNNNTTFHYAGRFQGESIPVTFSGGDYTLSELRCYVADWPADKGEELYQSPLAITDSWEDADTLSGTLEVEGEGLFVTSIPYDESFQVLVDGEEKVPARVNKGFLGVDMAGGKHEVSICYEAPGRKIGGALSVAGIILFAIERLILWKRKTQDKGSGIQKSRGR